MVFDLDGTLADNMDLHTQAFDVFVARHGLPAMTIEMRRRIDGKRNSEIFPLLFDRTMSRDEVRRYEVEKEGTYRELSASRLRPVPGVSRLLDRLSAHGIPVAIATSAPAENVAHTMHELGLTHRIPTVVRGDQVPHGKPAPDVYLHAADVLGVPAETCLAFEDAPLGVTAARAAGMPCVAIMTTFSPNVFEAAERPPTFICRDFDAFLAGPGRWLDEPVG